MDKTVIEGREIKVGDTVVVKDWLMYEYVVVDIPKKNVLKVAYHMIDPSYAVTTLVRGRKYWKEEFGRSYLDVSFDVTPEEVRAHNNSVEQSEAYMCM